VPTWREPGQPESGQPESGQGESLAAAAPAPAPAPATFHPPLVIFQAPEIPVTRATQTHQPPRPQAAPAFAAGPGPDGEGDSEDGESSREDGAQSSGGRRRRRGGRGRGKAGSETADSAIPAAADDRPGQTDQANGGDASEQDDEAGATGTGKRRRRRRRSGAGADGESLSAAVTADDPPNTVVHVRPPREKAEVTDVKAIKGSTRLEAKRQRRREGRESGRRRPPIITESEFLARREAVERVMVVRQHADRTQIAVLEDGVLVEHYVDKASHQSYVGNVYLGKVQNVLPSMEAAFVDIGKGRNAVLYAGEVNFDASGLEGESKRIESALKSGQSILVQVTKDPIGHKGARLTSQVSLPGRYLVYVPGASMTGISRKLPDTERSRLKQILKQVMPENAGVIVRTAAEGASEEELSRDVARLAAQWEAIEKKAKTASAPDLLYSEPDLTLRVVRDIFNEDFSNLIIASDSEWDLVDEYVRYVAPHLAGRMQRWDSDKDVFAEYRIDEQLAKALERKVWLPSGGSLVIDHTEAMNIIDVNTGKFTGQGGNLEQTVTRNNLEAAEEIVRQLRLRDLGGIIVIDFIDMVLESNRELVLRRLLECLARDRTKHQVAEVTSLGLVQMTRKRVGSGLLEAFSVPCEHCNGRGVIISLEPVDHSHGRDSGSGKDTNSSRNAHHRDNGSQDSGGGKGGHGRGRGSGSRGAGSSSAAVEAQSGEDEPGTDAATSAGTPPTPATVAAGTPRSRGSRSRAARPAGPPDPIAADGMPADRLTADDSADAATLTNGTLTDATQTDATQTDGAATDGTLTEVPQTDGAATDGTLTEAPQTDGAAPDGTLTDATQADGAVTDGSGSAVADGTAAMVTGQQTSLAGDALAPETESYETGTQETGVHETVAPETGAYDTGAPETGAYQTGAPETGAPKTGTPETEPDKTEPDKTEPDKTEPDKTEPDTVLVSSTEVDEPGGAASDGGDAEAPSDWPDQPWRSGPGSSQATGTLQGTDPDAESAST
jgi:ribonuclease E